jgi:hypothetical protein
VQLHLRHRPGDRLAVQLGEDGSAVPAAPRRPVGRHPADNRSGPAQEQPAGGDDRPGVVPAENVDGGCVGVVPLDLRRHPLFLDEDTGAEGDHLGPVRGRRDDGHSP